MDHPERELRRVCGFLGEAYDPAMLQFAKREDAEYLEVEGRMEGLHAAGADARARGPLPGAAHAATGLDPGATAGRPAPGLGFEPTVTERAPLHWHGLLWAERAYRKALLTLGVSRPLLDERTVLSRRTPRPRGRRPRPAFARRLTS